MSFIPVQYDLIALTVGCGFAPSMEALIAARAIAGMGGGGLTSIGSIVVSDVGEFTSSKNSHRRLAEENHAFTVPL